MPESTKRQSNDAVREKIVSDIEKSGFPLELHVLNICSKKNCGRMPSLRYQHHGELREIDLVTFLENISEPKRGKAPAYVATTLAIECKRSASKPWVFFSAPGYKFDNVACFLQYTSDLDLYFSSHGLIPLLGHIRDHLRTCHYADPQITRSVGYYEAFRDPDRPSEIYKAVESALNYIRYRRGLRDEHREMFGCFTEFMLPVIVLEHFSFRCILKLATAREM
jgi:hypothetical protein